MSKRKIKDLIGLLMAAPFALMIVGVHLSNVPIIGTPLVGLFAFIAFPVCIFLTGLIMAAMIPFLLIAAVLDMCGLLRP